MMLFVPGVPANIPSNNSQLLWSSIPLNAPYLNINNVAIKVDHLHAGNETSGPKTDGSVLCPRASERILKNQPEIRRIWVSVSSKNKDFH